jgi:hypothetical protein
MNTLVTAEGKHHLYADGPLLACSPDPGHGKDNSDQADSESSPAATQCFAVLKSCIQQKACIITAECSALCLLPQNVQHVFTRQPAGKKIARDWVATICSGRMRLQCSIITSMHACHVIRHMP